MSRKPQFDKNWPEWPTYRYGSVAHCFRVLYPGTNFQEFKKKHGFDKDKAYMEQPEYKKASDMYHQSLRDVEKTREAIKLSDPEAYVYYTWDTPKKRRKVEYDEWLKTDPVDIVACYYAGRNPLHIGYHTFDCICGTDFGNQMSHYEELMLNSFDVPFVLLCAYPVLKQVFQDVLMLHKNKDCKPSTVQPNGIDEFGGVNFIFEGEKYNAFYVDGEEWSIRHVSD